MDPPRVLELAIEAGTAGDEDDPAVSAVVFEHAVPEYRAVAGAAPDHARQVYDADDGGIARASLGIA